MNHNFKDIKGQKFGKLTVIDFSHKDKRGEAHWLCQCECGNQKTVSGSKLRSGNTKSCGCFQNEFRKKGIRKTHGMTNTRLYHEWCNMKSRCDKPSNIMYKNYGGRGIKHCEEWNKFEAFKDWALEHGYNDCLTLERIDVNGDYEPANCKWIPITEQYNNRTDSHFITAFGKTQTVKQWSEETGIKYDTIHARIKYYGWSNEDALSIKPRK